MIALQAAEQLRCDVPLEVQQHLTGLQSDWQTTYQGDGVPWATVSSDQVDKPRRRMLLKPAKTLVQYISRLNMAECTVSVEGDHRQSFIDTVLKQNRFRKNARKADERAEALGGIAIKPYASGGRLMIDFVRPECFIPLTWDNGGIREAMFVSRTVRNRTFYTKAEVHRFGALGKLHIDTYLFESQSESDVGSQVGFTRLPEFAAMEPHIVLNRFEPVFSYICPSLNDSDMTDCPLGISRFADAKDVIKACDIAFDELQVERLMSEKMIFASQYMVDKSIDIDGMPKIRYNHDTRVFQILNIDGKENQMPETFDPSFKINEHVKDLQRQLDLLCFKCNLDVGSLSFDGDGGIKTATEIRSQNSKTYSTVSDNQTVLSEAFEHLIRSLLWMGGEMGLISPGDADVKVTFDDSITPDHDTFIKEGVLLLQSGAISKRRFMTEYRGLTEEEADSEIAQINAENGAASVDLFGNLEGGA